MKRNPVTRIMKAKALTNPTPEFVSQVIAGANQEPHRVVKMDMGADEIAALFGTKELTMKSAVTKAQASGHDIAQLVFKGGEFTDRAKVDAWLKEGGFEGYEVTEKTDGDVPEFTVVSTTLKFETGSIKKIKGQAEGSWVFVGKVEAPEAPAEKTAEDETADATATKGSAVVVKADDAAPAADAPAPAADVPAVDAPVVDAAKDEGVRDAAAATVAPTAEADAPVFDVAKLDAFIAAAVAKGVSFPARKSTYTVSEVGGVLNSLRWLMEDAEWAGLSDGSIAAIKAAASQMLNVLVDAMQGTLDSFVETFKADAATKTDAVTTTKSDAAEAAPAAEAPAAPAPVMDPALVEVLKGIGTAISTLTETVKAQGEAIEEVKTTKATADAERLEQGQSRKGADVTDPAAPAVDTQKVDAEQAHAQRRLRSALGSYKGSGFDN